MAGRDAGTGPHRDICNLPVSWDTTIVHSTPPLWNEAWGPGAGRGPGQTESGQRRIAYATYEADRLPSWWVTTLNRYDAVLVPSGNSGQLCRDSGVTAPSRSSRISPTRGRRHRARPRSRCLPARSCST